MVRVVDCACQRLRSPGHALVLRSGQGLPQASALIRGETWGLAPAVVCLEAPASLDIVSRGCLEGDARLIELYAHVP